MTDNGRESPPAVPTAIKLGQKRFPYSNSPSLNTSQEGSQIGHHATENQDWAPNTSHVTQNRATESNTASNRRLSRAQTDIRSDRPPMTRQFQTELSRPRASTENAGKRNTRQRFRRQPTLTFDPYSSDSSSSSDEDEHIPHNRDGKVDGTKQAKTTKKSLRGPFSGFRIDHEDFHTKGRICRRDGRLKLHINETVNHGYFAKTLGAGLKKHMGGQEEEVSAKSSVAGQGGERIAPEDDIMEDPKRRIKLNIVIIVIGSRGDIQPFLRIGKILKEDYGHRVRIATHPAFKKFVEEDSGLEFFSVGGNPSELMAFMVKNPGLIPSLDTIKEGEIGKRRAAMYEMFQGMWRACTSSTDDESDRANLKMSKLMSFSDGDYANICKWATKIRL